MNRTRLDAEELRDAVLACAGTLNSKMGGAAGHSAAHRRMK